MRWTNVASICLYSITVENLRLNGLAIWGRALKRLKSATAQRRISITLLNLEFKYIDPSKNQMKSWSSHPVMNTCGRLLIQTRINWVFFWAGVFYWNLTIKLTSLSPSLRKKKHPPSSLIKELKCPSLGCCLTLSPISIRKSLIKNPWKIWSMPLWINWRKKKQHSLKWYFVWSWVMLR